MGARGDLEAESSYFNFNLKRYYSRQFKMRCTFYQQHSQVRRSVWNGSFRFLPRRQAKREVWEGSGWEVRAGCRVRLLGCLPKGQRAAAYTDVCSLAAGMLGLQGKVLAGPPPRVSAGGPLLFSSVWWPQLPPFPPPRAWPVPDRAFSSSQDTSTLGGRPS